MPGTRGAIDRFRSYQRRLAEVAVGGVIGGRWVGVAGDVQSADGGRGVAGRKLAGGCERLGNGNGQFGEVRLADEDYLKEKLVTTVFLTYSIGVQRNCWHRSQAHPIGLWIFPPVETRQ